MSFHSNGYWNEHLTIQPRVLVFGCGALGSVVAYYFTKAGCDVTVVCRSNHSIAQAEGFSVDFGGFTGQFRPRVTRTCAEAAAIHDVYDFLVVTSKAVFSADIAAAIAPAVETGHTTILLIQNGVGIEAGYFSRYPHNLILTCVAYCFATQLRPARTCVFGSTKLEMGPYPSIQGAEIPLSAQKIVSCLDDAGLAVSWHDDIQERRWLKLVLNAPFNPMCALTRSDDATILSASGELATSVVHGVMDEIVATARALGFTAVTREIAEQLLSKAKQTSPSKPIKPSMLADILSDREMEAEVILGNPLRHAKALGVDTPRLEMLYLLTRVVNTKLIKPQIARSRFDERLIGQVGRI